MGDYADDAIDQGIEEMANEIYPLDEEDYNYDCDGD